MEAKRDNRDDQKRPGVYCRIIMFKNIISPVQAWLLSQGKCVGCGRELEKKSGKGPARVTCHCGRVYIYDSEARSYRRATLDEIK